MGKLCSTRRCDTDGEERANLLQMDEAASLGEVGRKDGTYVTVTSPRLISKETAHKFVFC